MDLKSALALLTLLGAHTLLTLAVNAKKVVITTGSNQTCLYCYRSGRGEDCTTLRNKTNLSIEECNYTKPYCMVEHMGGDRGVTSFARKCAEDCTPGCATIGNYLKIEYCYDCCQTKYCNIGNSSPRLNHIRFEYIALLTLCMRVMKAM